MHNEIRRIACFGSGGVPWSLLPALYESGFEITQIFSPHIENAQSLAMLVNAHAICNIAHYNIADMVILAVPDSAVNMLLPIFKDTDTLTLHTAGSLSLQVFENQGIANYGVLYPLQTFTRGQRLNMLNIPIFVEGNSEANLDKLTRLAQNISDNVIAMTSAQRLYLHVAAVFACNFTNHCLSIATDILTKHNIDTQVIQQLVIQTMNKAISAQHPRLAQTGPAIRHDRSTMRRHLDILQKEVILCKLYKLMSESIMNTN
jgi:predicted short-subunit dehydrogenase-like oxidoreductase (DUF2520 family)